jgi:hypothetical protein
MGRPTVKLTGRERTFREDEVIVSKTDLKIHHLCKSGVCASCRILRAGTARAGTQSDPSFGHAQVRHQTSVGYDFTGKRNICLRHQPQQKWRSLLGIGPRDAKF